MYGLTTWDYYCLKEHDRLLDKEAWEVQEDEEEEEEEDW